MAALADGKGEGALAGFGLQMAMAGTADCEESYDGSYDDPETAGLW